MTRGKPRRPEALGQFEHYVEADVPVAGDARVGGASLGVARDEAIDDLRAKAVAHVECDVRDAHLVSKLARAGHRLRRAAGALAVAGRVGPELEGHGHDLVAGVERELGHRGAVDPAAQGYQRASR